MKRRACILWFVMAAIFIAPFSIGIHGQSAVKSRYYSVLSNNIKVTIADNDLNIKNGENARHIKLSGTTDGHIYPRVFKGKISILRKLSLFGNRYEITSCEISSVNCTKLKFDAGFVVSDFVPYMDGYLLLETKSSKQVGPSSSKLYYLNNSKVSLINDVDLGGVFRLIVDGSSEYPLIDVSVHGKQSVIVDDILYVNPYQTGIFTFSGDGILTHQDYLSSRISNCFYAKLFRNDWICAFGKEGDFYESLYCCENSPREVIFLKSASLPFLAEGKIVYENVNGKVEIRILLGRK